MPESAMGCWKDCPAMPGNTTDEQVIYLQLHTLMRPGCPHPLPYLLPYLQVKLIDLGMAGLYRPKRPMHGCMGSPGFIAPEVILGEAHSVSPVQLEGTLCWYVLVWFQGRGMQGWTGGRHPLLEAGCRFACCYGRLKGAGAVPAPFVCCECFLTSLP